MTPGAETLGTSFPDKLRAESAQPRAARFSRGRRVVPGATRAARHAPSDQRPGQSTRDEGPLRRDPQQQRQQRRDAERGQLLVHLARAVLAPRRFRRRAPKSQRQQRVPDSEERVDGGAGDQPERDEADQPCEHREDKSREKQPEPETPKHVTIESRKSTQQGEGGCALVVILCPDCHRKEGLSPCNT